MSTDTINYTEVLADLEAKRAALDAAIAGIRQLLGQGGAVVPGTPGNVVEPTEVESDSFFNMSIADAARKYLRMTKKKQTTAQIADALQRGGIHSTAKNFTTTLYSILDRQDDVVRVGREWGLALWYPHLKGKKKTKGGTEKIEEPEAGEAEEKGEDKGEAKLSAA